jgi:hypothetical protein
MIRKEKTPGRNAQCPCGSGKKVKKCCRDKIKVRAGRVIALEQALFDLYNTIGGVEECLPPNR